MLIVWLICWSTTERTVMTCLHQVMRFINIFSELVVYRVLGPVVVNHLQTPPPLPQKQLYLFFGPNRWETFWNEWKPKNKMFAIFLSYDRFYSQFSSVFNRPNLKIKCLKRCAMFWKRIFESNSFFVRLLVSKLWSILCFIFVLHSGLGRIQKIYYVRGHCPLNLQSLCRALTTSTGGSAQRSHILLDWKVNWWKVIWETTGSRVSLDCVSKSSSWVQKSLSPQFTTNAE